MNKIISTALLVVVFGLSVGCSDKSPEPADTNTTEVSNDPEKGTYGYGDGAFGVETFNFVGEVLLKALAN